MTRREALKFLIFGTAAALPLPEAVAQTTHWETRGLANGTHPFALEPLPYGFDALSPNIDERMLKTHYLAVHWGYVTELNKSIGLDLEFYVSWAGTGRISGTTNTKEHWLETMLKDPYSIPARIRNAVVRNAGGHYNHSLFWQMMKKDGGGEPTGGLATVIAQRFGDFARFKDELLNAALRQFGSGWAWLTLQGKSLNIETTSNEDSPLSLGREVLLGIDLWEHAYYSQYQDRRADYVNAWFNVINWDFVAKRYAKFTS